MECLICCKKGGKKAFVKTASLASSTKLIERVNDRASHKDSAVTSLAERLMKHLKSCLRKILYITEISTQKLQMWRNLRELKHVTQTQ